MKILIIYATTEGQTAKVAEYAAARLAAEGHDVTCHAAGPGAPAPDGVAGVILAGSVHAGRYQAALIEYARAHADALGRLRTLFLSVSLAAAGDLAEDWAGLAECVQRFGNQTGWAPGQVEHVAGALRFSEYDFFRYWTMRWIAHVRDEDAAPGEDKEYTDWTRLGAALDDWAAA